MFKIQVKIIETGDDVIVNCSTLGDLDAFLEQAAELSNEFGIISIDSTNFKEE